MALEQVAREGLVLLGCGKMGTALLTGWLAAGVPAGIGLGAGTATRPIG